MIYILKRRNASHTATLIGTARWIREVKDEYHNSGPHLVWNRFYLSGLTLVPLAGHEGIKGEREVRFPGLPPWLSHLDCLWELDGDEDRAAELRRRFSRVGRGEEQPWVFQTPRLRQLIEAEAWEWCGDDAELMGVRGLRKAVRAERLAARAARRSGGLKGRLARRKES